jgi:hypothetical protein
VAVQHWVVKNSDFGPCWSSGPNAADNCVVYGGRGDSSLEFEGIYGGSEATQSFLDFQMLNNTIHDFELVTTGDHFECVRGGGNTSWPLREMVWRGNRFWNCEIYVFSLSGLGPNSYIENNWFGGSEHGADNPTKNDQPRGTAIAFGTSVSGPIYIRFNSFQSLEGMISEGPERNPPPNTVYVIGNLVGHRQCIPNVIYGYNIYDDVGTCGGAGEVGGHSFPYANGSRNGSLDYHLAGASIADGFVPAAPNSALTTDFDGQPRFAPGTRAQTSTSMTPVSPRHRVDEGTEHQRRHRAGRGRLARTFLRSRLMVYRRTRSQARTSGTCSLASGRAGQVATILEQCYLTPAPSLGDAPNSLS